MYRTIMYLSILISLCSCTKDIDLKHLEGYWEIEEVLMPDNDKREYQINTTIDYIEFITDSTAFRTKLYPKFDGTFETSQSRELMNFNHVKDKILIKYKTNMAEWTEELIQLDESRLILENDRSIRYIYKRFKKFN